MRFSSLVVAGLFVSFSLAVSASDEECDAKRASLLESGVVLYDELVIDRPVKAVFPALLEFSKWNESHVTAKHTLVKGKKGQPGELVEILKAHKGAKPYMAELLRIRPLTLVEGDHMAGNVVWKIYPKEGCTGGYNFVDFGVREFKGKTILYKSYYAQMPMTEEEVEKSREEQKSNPVNWLRKSSLGLKEYMEKNL